MISTLLRSFINSGQVLKIVRLKPVKQKRAECPVDKTIRRIKYTVLEAKVNGYFFATHIERLRSKILEFPFFLNFNQTNVIVYVWLNIIK